MPFLSRILETVVHAQLKSSLDEHNVLEVFQSGFQTLHSTESALLRVFNDVLLANDSGDDAVLVLSQSALARLQLAQNAAAALQNMSTLRLF